VSVTSSKPWPVGVRELFEIFAATIEDGLADGGVDHGGRGQASFRLMIFTR
jgi:hypothetical protein